MRPIAVFRFSPTEGPAHFAEWLDRESLPWELIAVDDGAQRAGRFAALFAGIGMMGGPMSVYEALAVDRAAVAAAARRGRARGSGDRPLPGRTVARAGARSARAQDRRARDRLDRRRDDRRERAARMVRRPRAVHAVPVALRRVRPAGGCHARADESLQPQSGLRDRRAAHRVPVPHRNDARPRRHVVRERRRRNRSARNAAAPVGRRDPAATCRRASLALHAVADGVYARWAEGLAR